MPIITQLTPELYCSNFQTSLHFYTQVLGFSIQYAREEEGFAMLERQGSRLMIEEVPVHCGQKRIWLSGLLEHPYGRGVNFEIRTIEIEQLYEHIQKLGMELFLPIEDKWYRVGDVELGNRQFIVLDPDGYMLRFAQYLGTRDY